MKTALRRPRALRVAVVASLAFGLSLSSAQAAVTPQDPWATDALQFTAYLKQIQTFPTSVKAATTVPALAPGGGRQARRAYAQQVSAADMQNLKLAKRAVNDLTTLNERATRDSEQSRDNRNAAIEVAFAAESTTLIYQHASEAAASETTYARSVLAEQSKLDSQLNQSQSDYNAAVIANNNNFGAEVSNERGEYRDELKDCPAVPADPIKPKKPARKKSKSAAAYKKRLAKQGGYNDDLAAYKKRVAKQDKAETKFNKCKKQAANNLDAAINGVDVSENDGLTGQLAAASAQTDLDKQARDQGIQSGFSQTVAGLDAKYNQDKLDNDYDNDLKTQALQARRENAITRSNRLFDEESDITVDAYRQSIRLIEDTYSATDEDLGVDSSAS